MNIVEMRDAPSVFGAKVAMLERGDTWEAKARRLEVENRALRAELETLREERIILRQPMSINNRRHGH